MKDFPSRPSLNLHLTEQVIDALEVSKFIRQTSPERSMGEWLTRWTRRAPERLDSVLFLAALRFQLKSLASACGLAIDAPSVSEFAVSLDGDGSIGSSKRATHDALLPFDSRENVAPEWTLQRLLTALDHACTLKPEQEPKFWHSLYKRRSGELDAIRSFLQEPSASLCYVSGEWGSGKSTFLTEKAISLSYLPRKPTDGGSSSVLTDFFYLDVTSLEAAMEHAYRETVQNYGDDGTVAQDVDGTIREVLFGRIEAILERQVVLQIQRRLADYFYALLTGKPAAPTAKHPNLQLHRKGGDAVVDTEFLDHWVPCYVVAAVLAVISSEHRKPAKSNLLGDLRGLESILDELVLRVASSGSENLQDRLARHDIGCTEGSLWRTVYSVWFGRGRPALILDSVDSSRSSYLHEPTLCAALGMGSVLPSPQLQFVSDWKILIAVRNPAPLEERLSKEPHREVTSIALGPATDADGNTKFLPASPEQVSAIIESRVEYAFDAAGRPVWLWPQLNAILGKIRSSYGPSALQGCDSIAARLESARELTKRTLGSWFDLHYPGVGSDAKGLEEISSTDRVSLQQSMRAWLQSLGACPSDRPALTLFPSHTEIMQVSEARLLEVACWGRAATGNVARRLIADEALYERWLQEHRKLTARVAREGTSFSRAVALRRVCLRLIQRKAMFDHLREHNIRGSERSRLFRFMYGPGDYAAAVIDEHRNYICAASSLICVTYLGTRLFKDGPFLDSRFAAYEAAYCDYFRLWVATSTRGEEDWIPLRSIAKRQADAVGRQILQAAQGSAADSDARELSSLARSVNGFDSPEPAQTAASVGRVDHRLFGRFRQRRRSYRRMGLRAFLYV